MNLAENLRYLRKRDQITQEELADRLGVSRQSVSKWETGEAYPETDKLIALCDLFEVTLDRIVRGSLTDKEEEITQERAAEPLAETNVKEYAAHMNRYSVGVSVGVFLALLGLAACVALIGLSQNYSKPLLVVLQSLGVASLFLFDGAAAFFFIYGGIRHGRFRKKTPEINGDFDDKEKETFHKKFAAWLSALVAAIFLDLIVLIVFTSLVSTGVISVKDTAAALSYVAASFFFVLAFIVGGIVFLGIRRTKYNIAEYNRRSAEDKNFASRRKIYGAFCGVVMLIATALYFILIVIENSRGSAWIVYPVGGVLCGIAATVMHAKNKDKK